MVWLEYWYFDLTWVKTLFFSQKCKNAETHWKPMIFHKNAQKRGNPWNFMDFSQTCTKIQKSLEFYGFFTNRPLKGTLRGCIPKWPLSCAASSGNGWTALHTAQNPTENGLWQGRGWEICSMFTGVRACPCMSVHDLRISVSWCVVWCVMC